MGDFDMMQQHLGGGMGGAMGGAMGGGGGGMGGGVQIGGEDAEMARIIEESMQMNQNCNIGDTNEEAELQRILELSKNDN